MDLNICMFGNDGVCFFQTLLDQATDLKGTLDLKRRVTCLDCIDLRWWSGLLAATLYFEMFHMHFINSVLHYVGLCFCYGQKVLKQVVA